MNFINSLHHRKIYQINSINSNWYKCSVSALELRKKKVMIKLSCSLFSTLFRKQKTEERVLYMRMCNNIENEKLSTSCPFRKPSLSQSFSFVTDCTFSTSSTRTKNRSENDTGYKISLEKSLGISKKYQKLNNKK